MLKPLKEFIDVQSVHLYATVSFLSVTYWRKLQCKIDNVTTLWTRLVLPFQLLGCKNHVQQDPVVTLVYCPPLNPQPPPQSPSLSLRLKKRICRISVQFGNEQIRFQKSFNLKNPISRLLKAPVSPEMSFPLEVENQELFLHICL